MTNRSANEGQQSARHTGVSLHQLVDEVRVLIGSLPDLREAIDLDALPIAFILERDAPRDRDWRHDQPSDR
jgi:hypothetical protein